MKKTQKIALLFAIAMTQTTIKTSEQPSYLKTVVKYGKYGVPIVVAGGLGGLLGTYKYGPKLYNTYFGNETEKRFGYDPQFHGLPEEGKKENEGKIAVITGHGFGDTSSNYIGRFDSKNAYTVSFNFPDAYLLEQTTINDPSLSSNILNGLKKIGTFGMTDIGGFKNAEPILYAMKKCAESNNPIVLMGHSRGVAAIINALGILHLYSKPYKSTLQDLGISGEVFSQMKKSTKKVFLANPLLCLHEALKCISQNFYEEVIGPIQTKKEIEQKTKNSYRLTKPLWKGYYKYFPSIVTGLGSNVSNAGLLIGTKCSYFGPSPIDTLENLVKSKNIDLKFDITLATKDEVVGNKLDDKLTKLAKKYSEKMTVSKANYFGHCDTSQTWINVQNYLEDGQDEPQDLTEQDLLKVI